MTSSDLQYGFKAKVSEIMATTVFMETLDYYLVKRGKSTTSPWMATFDGVEYINFRELLIYYLIDYYTVCIY